MRRPRPVGVAAGDRVAVTTRLLAIVIVPFLLAGFIILFAFPDDSAALFAWPVRPRMTAMMLGAAYLGGSYYFVRVALARTWHSVQAGMLPVALFAAMLGVATIVHWPRFTHGHPAFYAWTALYFTTPFAVLGAWLWNRRQDPGGQAAELALRPLVRIGLAAAGALTLAVAAALFADPTAAAKVWPWSLTPLTGRVVAALFAVGGASMFVVGADRRWDAARVTLQAQAVSLVAIEVAAAISHSDLDPANPLTSIFIGGLLLLLAVAAGCAFVPRLACTGR